MGFGSREANRKAREADEKVAAEREAKERKAAADAKAAADKAERDRIAGIVREVTGAK